MEYRVTKTVNMAQIFAKNQTFQTFQFERTNKRNFSCNSIQMSKMYGESP